MAACSFLLAWKIPWTESPVSYSQWGCKRVGATKYTFTHTLGFPHGRIFVRASGPSSSAALHVWAAWGLSPWTLCISPSPSPWTISFPLIAFKNASHVLTRPDLLPGLPQPACLLAFHVVVSLVP